MSFKKRSTYFFSAINTVILIIVSITCQAASTQSPTDKRVLKNEDIVSLAKAGLSDATIISLIQKTPNEFDLTPAGLVKLKESGVSNAVIESMVGAHTGTGPVSSPATPSLPSAYGHYLLDGSQTRKIDPTVVTTKIGLSILNGGGNGIAVDGLAGEPAMSIEVDTPTLIVYQQSVNIQDIHFSKLVYVASMQAYQFNMTKTAPEFFSNIYRRGYYDVIPIGLWRPQTEVSTRIEPVEGRPGMFKITPDSPLQDGKYVIYFGDNIHKDGIIFATREGRRTEALYFKKVKSGVGASGTVSNDSNAGVMRDLMGIEYLLITANKTGDKATFNKFLADEFVLSQDGKSYSKTQLLEKVKPEKAIKTFDIENAELSFEGETAVLTGISVIQAQKLLMNFTIRQKFIDRFVKRNGQWQIVASQVSTMK